jgi:hypothetical protein
MIVNMWLRSAQFDEISEHLERERFATVGNIFPALNLVDNPLNFGR